MTPPPALALADLDRIKEEIGDDFDEELIEYGTCRSNRWSCPTASATRRHPVPPEMYVPSQF